MKWYALGFMLLTMLLVVACGAPAITPQTLPEIVYGEDVCDHCGMIINDDHFAAGVVIQTQHDQYEHRIFDDIGDMFAYAKQLIPTMEMSLSRLFPILSTTIKVESG
jgi:nitrous oxide reductase accessory protein NosL